MIFISDGPNSYLKWAASWSPTLMMDIGDGLLLGPHKDITGYLNRASTIARHR